MGIFSWFTNKSDKIESFDSLHVPEKWGNEWFYPLKSFGSLFGQEEYIKDFAEVPEIANIINIRAKAMASGTMQEIVKATEQEVKQQSELLKILLNPNWFQAYSEFWRQSEIFRCISGNEFLYFNKPFGMSDMYNGLFTLIPFNVEIKYTGNKNYFLETDNSAVEYWYKNQNEKIKLEKDNLIHLNDNRITTTENFLKGTSKLKALQPNIQNIRRAYRKRGIILDMPVGVFSSGSNDGTGMPMPMDQTEKEKAEKKLKSKLGRPILTELGLSYANLATSPASMGLFEEVEADTMRICDAYGVPYELLSNAKNNGLSNGGGKLKELKKQMYEETTMPEVQEKLDAINQQFLGDESKTEIIGKFDHLAIFEDDKRQRAMTYKTMVEALSKALADKAINIEQYQQELNKL